MQRADPVASTISDPSRLRLAQFFSTHDDEFRDTFRMSKRTFNRLCASITLRRDELQFVNPLTLPKEYCLLAYLFRVGLSLSLSFSLSLSLSLSRPKEIS